MRLKTRSRVATVSVFSVWCEVTGDIQPDGQVHGLEITDEATHLRRDDLESMPRTRATALEALQGAAREKGLLKRR